MFKKTLFSLIIAGFSTASLAQEISIPADLLLNENFLGALTEAGDFVRDGKMMRVTKGEIPQTEALETQEFIMFEVMGYQILPSIPENTKSMPTLYKKASFLVKMPEQIVYSVNKDSADEYLYKRFSDDAKLFWVGYDNEGKCEGKISAFTANLEKVNAKPYYVVGYPASPSDAGYAVLIDATMMTRTDLMDIKDIKCYKYFMPFHNQ